MSAVQRDSPIPEVRQSGCYLICLIEAVKRVTFGRSGLSFICTQDEISRTYHAALDSGLIYKNCWVTNSDGLLDLIARLFGWKRCFLGFGIAPEGSVPIVKGQLGESTHFWLLAHKEAVDPYGYSNVRQYGQIVSRRFVMEVSCA